MTYSKCLIQSKDLIMKARLKEAVCGFIYGLKSFLSQFMTTPTMTSNGALDQLYGHDIHKEAMVHGNVIR